jgi:predicted ArsR family transcriptional regulator
MSNDHYSPPVDYGPLFRTTDPETSKLAGQQAREFDRTNERRILEALAAGPAHRDEIARRAGMTRDAVWRRLAAMERRGDIQKCGTARGESGMRQSVYRASAASR